MDLVLTPVEIRVLGCLIEKEATTPESYPLSLNALATACNQKTNRDPVMNLDPETVQAAVDHLVKRTLVAARSGAGSRVVKYIHRLHERVRPEFDFSREELAPMCLLFLRGPQTLGEIKARGARIHPFGDIAELAAVLERLAAREDGPYVKRLPRRPGQKEARYMHLVGGEPIEPEVDEETTSERGVVSDQSARIAELELEVRSLRNDLDALRARVDTFVQQFE